MAVSEGKQFEADWKQSCESAGIFIDRFKDSAMFGQAVGTRVIAGKNPSDFYAYEFPYFYFMECKSTKGTSFSLDEKIIKKNQIDKMWESQRFYGIIAGFFFNFRPRKTKTSETENKLYYMPISNFVRYKRGTSKSSINEDDCIANGFLVPCRAKILHFSYDVHKFIELATEQYEDTRNEVLETVVNEMREKKLAKKEKAKK